MCQRDVGGYDGTASTTLTTIEVFSPNGQCSYQLSDFPVPAQEGILVLLSNQIYHCFGYEQGFNNFNKNQDCYKYIVSTDIRVKVTTSHNAQFQNPGMVYQNKLFMLNDIAGQSEVYDPDSDVWSSWDSPTTPIGFAPCVVQWNDSFIVMVGLANPVSVQMYNLTTKAWTNLASMLKTFANFGCTMLPGSINQILVMSFIHETDVNSSADIYDLGTNTWQNVQGASIGHSGTRLVTLGSRIFAIGGNSLVGNMVEEFNPDSKSWSKISFRLKGTHLGPAVISIPATLFNYFFHGCTGVE